MVKKRSSSFKSLGARPIVSRLIRTLKPHPRQREIFTDLSEQAIQELADDIDHNGLINPVEIMVDGTIIAGHGRVAAARLLGWQKIECWLRDDLTAEDVDRRHIEDNLHRRQLSRLDTARAYVALKALDDGVRNGAAGDIRDVLGARLGVGGRTLDRLVRILGTPIEIQLAFDSGQLTLKEGLAVAALGSGDQVRLATSIRRGTSPREALAKYAKVEAQEPSPRSVLEGLVRCIEQSYDPLTKNLHRFNGLASVNLPGLRRGQELLASLVKQICGTDTIGDAVKSLHEKFNNSRKSR